jgi:hypothetical protein
MRYTLSHGAAIVQRLNKGYQMNLSNKERCGVMPAAHITPEGVAAISGGFQRSVRVGFFASNGRLLGVQHSKSCTWQGDAPSATGFAVPSGTAWVKTEVATYGNQAREYSRVYRLVQVAPAKEFFGATYSTKASNFGETISVFPVSADWDGWRHHGYCRATPEEYYRR